MGKYDGYEARIREVATDHAEGKVEAFFEESGLRDSRFWRDYAYVALETLDDLFMRSIPSADISGQWADEPTPSSILTEAGIPPSVKEADRNELIDVYLATFDSVVLQRIRAAVAPKET